MVCWCLAIGPVEDGRGWQDDGVPDHRQPDQGGVLP